MIHLIGKKAKNPKNIIISYLKNLCFDFDVNVIIGTNGTNINVQKFYKKRTLCIDGAGKNARRVLLNSYRYDIGIIPELCTPDRYNVHLQSNENGYIVVFLSNSRGFWNHKWRLRLENVINITKKQSREVYFKLHPNENPQIKRILRSKKCKIIKNYDMNELYCAVVQGGFSCYDLVKSGIPLFCFDNIKHMYLCDVVASNNTDIKIDASKYNEIVYNDFIYMVDKHTISYEYLEKLQNLNKYLK